MRTFFAVVILSVLIAACYLLPRRGIHVEVERAARLPPADGRGGQNPARSDEIEPVGPEAAEEVRELHDTVVGFLEAVKDPHRPPLGINEDFAKALTGGNRYGDVFLATNHPALNDRGQIIDRWGTPYHFHPRAPDAIDVRSAGPDRLLFTDDDILVR